MHTETKNLGKAKALGILPAVAALMVEPHQYPSYQLILITQGTIPEIFATFLGELAVLEIIFSFFQNFFFFMKISQKSDSKDGSEF